MSGKIVNAINPEAERLLTLLKEKASGALRRQINSSRGISNAKTRSIQQETHQVTDN